MRKIVIFSLEGRVGRRAFSIGVSAYLALMLTMHMIVPMSQIAGWYAFAGLFILASAMLVGMGVRRVHDFGRPGSNALWTTLPFCESAAVISLYSGAPLLGLETKQPYVVFVATAILAVWGVIGTAAIMRRKGDEGDNAYGPPADSALPQVLVAGGGTIGLVGAKAVQYGATAAEPKRLRWGWGRDDRTGGDAS